MRRSRRRRLLASMYNLSRRTLIADSQHQYFQYDRNSQWLKLFLANVS
jgi:hypothetical protein